MKRTINKINEKKEKNNNQSDKKSSKDVVETKTTEAPLDETNQADADWIEVFYYI